MTDLSGFMVTIHGIARKGHAEYQEKNSAVVSGYQIYHNFIRPHSALKGKTPSKACGIEIKGEDKWKTLIENATHARRESKPMGKLEDFM